jgi:thiosulfate reductase cytochrome b subunit
MSEKIYIFKRFERFWHWSQAGLIMFLMLTAFDIHGTYTIFGFEKAVGYHTTAAWTLVGLWVFAIFWHLTTGEWRQYVPTTTNVVAMIKYYLSGIFKHAPHPHRQTQLTKHNPLQRLAYLFILVFVGPLIWFTGWLYLFYDQWAAWGLGSLSLEWVATGHTIGAFLMLIFLIAHVYLITAGATLTSHLKAMITGWEEVH